MPKFVPGIMDGGQPCSFYDCGVIYLPKRMTGKENLPKPFLNKSDKTVLFGHRLVP